MNPRYLLLIAVLSAILILPIASTLEGSEEARRSFERLYSRRPLMQPDLETRHRLLKQYNPDLHAHVDSEAPTQGTSYSLLSHLDYVPAERDQGSCGNCWVWAGTGVLEVALDVNEGIFDRLSVQYFNSKYNGGTGPNWAGCGGDLSQFAEFYDSEEFIIPWSNTNAAYADGHQTADEGTSVPWQTIGTIPNYTLTQCTRETIATQEVGKTTAINNIKNVINQGRAVWFGYFLATEADWNQFFSFWNYESESAIWNPDFSCGDIWDTGGGGHAVLCVGYNDEDPNNAYWIMVNSWGTAYGGRPNGIFRLDMDMNYDCYFYDPYPWGYYSFYWETLNATYDVEAGGSPPTLASINSKLQGSQNGAYFIFADPTRMLSIAAYDVASGGIVYGLFENPQNIGFDSNPDSVVQIGIEKGKVTLCGKTILFFGGPSPHWCVSYYENTGIAPARAYYNATTNAYDFATQSGNPLASLPTNTDFDHEDMFIIYVFKDNNNNTIYTFYGFSWKGTWAAGIYFHDCLHGQITTLTNNCYVYHWSDASLDGMPQPNEIHQESP